MTKVIVDAALRTRLHNLDTALELYDEAGRLLGRFLPATEAPPKYVNAQVLHFAQDHLGQQVGDGECSTLAQKAVADAGGKPFDSLGPTGPDADYVWGERITTLTPSAGSVDDIQPGDIIQFRNVKLTKTVETHHPDGSSSTMSNTQDMTHHTAIVRSLHGEQIEVLQQNVMGNRTVQVGTIWADSYTDPQQVLPDGTKVLTTYTFNGGTMWVYRPYA
jgi:hypothetical protein